MTNKLALLGAIVTTILRLPSVLCDGVVASLDGSQQDYDDEVLRLPFRKAVGCVGASYMKGLEPPSYNPMPVELDKYLRESLAAYNFVRVEEFNVDSYSTVHSITSNKSNTTTSALLLRRTAKDNEESLSESKLELSGVAIFATRNSTNPAKVVTPSSETRRSAIYSRVGRWLAETHGRVMTALLNNNAAHVLPSTDPVTHRRNLQTCSSVVPAPYFFVPGELMCSENGACFFGLGDDGDLGIWKRFEKIWSAGTHGRGNRLTLEPDGNLVVRDDNGTVMWESYTSGTWDSGGLVKVTNIGVVSIVNKFAFKRTHIVPNYTTVERCVTALESPSSLMTGQRICSPNEMYSFALTEDGDLGIFFGPKQIWSAGLCCADEGIRAEFQTNGNFVVTTQNGNILWESGSTNDGGSIDENPTLRVGDDGVVTITDTILGHIWSSATVDEERNRVATDSLLGKVMAGYQGWFFTDGDGGPNTWWHWSKPHDAVPNEAVITIDVWPDLRELDSDELYPTNFTYEDGSNAGVFSSYNTKTVERHTNWMQEYGIHGVFVQRFISDLKRSSEWADAVDKVLANVRGGAEKYGRAFANMYDVSSGDDEGTIVDDIINDWKHLVDDEHITKSRQYLHHRGRPLVAIWGFGFNNRPGTPEHVATIIDWFQNTAEDKYKATIMGGVPIGWRDLTGASWSEPEWAAIYRSFDVISPWTVGRFEDVESANEYRTNYTIPDLAECERLGIDYLPVVYPGFSFHNLKPEKPFNEIPRNGGRFMWNQMHTAVAAGSKMLYVAMFDEVDEGTAIFKIAETQQETPMEGQFLAADSDGYSNCPGDWYLSITGRVAGLLEQDMAVPLDMPAYP